MKRILGAAASVLLWLNACGDDGPSVENQASAGSSANASGAAGDASAPGGQGGEPVTTPVGLGGGNSGEGGVPADLAGAGGAGGSSEVLSDVSGVITSFVGTPLANVVVIIDDASTVTDEDGAFTIADVPASYDLTAIDNERKFVQVVERLTTRAPRVGFWQMRLAKRSGGVAGKLSGGGGFPVPAGQAGLVSFRGARSGLAQAAISAGGTSFSLNTINWEGDVTHQGLLTGIFWKTGASGPTEYTGYAQRSLLIEADKTIGNINGTVAASNLDLTDPVEHTVTGTLALTGAPLDVTSALELGRNSVPLNLAAGPISIVVPEVEPPVGVAVTVIAEFPAGLSSFSTPLAGKTEVALQVPPPPQLVLPVEAALGVTLATEFSWKAPTAGSYSLVVWSMGVWSVARVTAENKVKLPDLSAAGVVFSEGDFASTWYLEHRGPAQSAEEALQLFDGTSASYGSVVTTFGTMEREFQLAD